jgi:hypothetical protein
MKKNFLMVAFFLLIGATTGYSLTTTTVKLEKSKCPNGGIIAFKDANGNFLGQASYSSWTELLQSFPSKDGGKTTEVIVNMEFFSKLPQLKKFVQIKGQEIFVGMYFDSQKNLPIKNKKITVVSEYVPTTCGIKGFSIIITFK